MLSHTETLEIRGHIIDSMLFTRILDQVLELRGSYQAMWRRDSTGAAWRLQSELYVTLGCAGSARCGR